MKPIIYLDMDGVCTDFASAGIRANGRDPAAVLATWNQSCRGEFLPYQVMGLDSNEYWEAIAQQGESFWINLQEYEWYPKLICSLWEIGEVVFLTSGTYAPGSLSGKLIWLQHRFGHDFQGYVFTAKKYLLASPWSILIDDYERNVTEFRQYGGKAILFPQIWNSNCMIHNQLEFTLESVKQFVNELRVPECDDCT
jgi:5'(3')-deoxyribonucleotidase